MNSIPRIWFVVAAISVVSEAVLADTVWNKQGVAVEGEVLRDEPGKPLVFRCKHKGEWRTFEISRDDIRKFTRAPGDQSDGADLPSDQGEEENSDEQASTNGEDRRRHVVRKLPQPLVRCAELTPLLQEIVPAPKNAAPEVVVLHLNGPIALPTVADIGKIISSGELDVLLDFASQRNPLAIVLKINSGGGRVDEMDAIIERLLQEQDAPKNHRVVAWVNLGGSAAALTALACKELVMTSQGRLGAATFIYGNGEAVEAPDTALEQKMAAMRDARRRQVATLTGRPLAIQDAMEKPEHQLWHHPVLGFSLEEQDDSEWDAYDADENKPLALDAKSAVDLGIAVGIANDAKSLLAALKLSSDTHVVDIDLAAPEFQAGLQSARAADESGNQAIKAFEKRVGKEIDDAVLAIRAATGIQMANNGYTLNDLRVFRSAVAKLQSPSIDSKTREYLKKVNPDRLEFYELKLAHAQRLLKRARQATDDASRADGISIGAILSDIELAKHSLLEVQIGRDLPEE
jgi:hypothetical protein